MSPKNTNVMDGNKALVLTGIKGVFIDRDPTMLNTGM
jgi:hypothetical protein